MTLSAALSDGSALPSWLVFDAQSASFSGTPLNAEGLSYAIRVTATDNSGESVDSVFTLSVGDSLLGTSGADTLIGTPGNDSIDGLSGADTLLGGAGDDSLQGWTGDDVLNGGAGDDWLQGYNGDDVYEFDLGWGQDTISNNDYLSSTDTIRFGTGIAASDISVSREVDSLHLTHVSTGDNVELVEYFRLSAFAVDAIEFADGTIWDQAAIKAMFPVATEGDDDLIGDFNHETIDGLGGNDTIDGHTGDDTLLGGAGDDSLQGGYGDDVLNGGTGDDWLQGRNGDDTYQFDLGWGQDQINNYDYHSSSVDKVVFGTGISASDISVSRIGNNLHLTHVSGGDNVQVTSYFSSAASSIDQVEFADGTIWDQAELDLMAATSGNDTLVGTNGVNYLDALSGDDILTGAAGNDILLGGIGDDIYQFSPGDGLDLINDTAGVDAINYSGVDYDQLWLWQDSDDLRIGVRDTSDWITVKDWYLTGSDNIEAINSIDDSFTLVETQVQQLVQAMAIFDVQAAGNLNVSQADVDSVQSAIAVAWSTT
ncbi:MAG: hypothetical protein GKR93_09880 [Gammaproteobacteria bacterium]|nr:hypothetical protein [Gammaproteobacteria bacterium]